VMSLVRERNGAIAFDPPGFRAGDRWKLRVTCDPGASIFADVVVYQPDLPGGAARASFPLAATRVPCGNDVTVPGAFRLDGAAPALVCIALATGAPPDRAMLARGPHH